MAYSLGFVCNDTATTEIYTLSLHDALPIFEIWAPTQTPQNAVDAVAALLSLPKEKVTLHQLRGGGGLDRKSTRLNSSHSQISYAVFCLKKKKKIRNC